jgi:acyl-CoA thioesterase-1
MKTHIVLAVLTALPVFVAGAQREPRRDQLQQLLQRFPDADLNKDGKLTPEEIQEFRRQRRAGAFPRSADAATNVQMPELAPIQNNPALPRVLLIGDSISVGYTLAVREALAGKANVHRPAANCGSTRKGLQYLSQWLGDGLWDVIHFNWGLHDLTSIDDKPQVPINQYEKNLRELVSRLKKTGATLVWGSTTPVPPERRAPITPEDVVRYNEVARNIMDENGITIDDLYAFALPQLKDIQRPRNVHLTPEGSKVLAQQVAASIEAVLKQR